MKVWMSWSAATQKLIKKKILWSSETQEYSMKSAPLIHTWEAISLEQNIMQNKILKNKAVGVKETNYHVLATDRI